MPETPNKNYTDEIRRLADEIEPDYQKNFNESNKAAGIRLRFKLSKLRQLVASFRAASLARTKKVAR